MLARQSSRRRNAPDCGSHPERSGGDRDVSSEVSYFSSNVVPSFFATGAFSRTT